MKAGMIEVLSGHLGSGRWRLKQEGGMTFLSHIQPFSRRGEFRLGADQVKNITIESHEQSCLKVRIDLEGDSYCIARINPVDLPRLQSMIEDERVPPLAKSQQNTWILGLSIFFVVCIIFEMSR